ncbi:polyprenyl synthetase family protein [Balneolales bacterium ANBcel1]|nr:polyprenyl synthetase family protein [Balneolales bacterium ANBcel1]
MTTSETENKIENIPPSITSLKEIQKPLEKELKEFKAHFKKQLQTDVFLLNRIIGYLMRMKGKEMRPILVLLSARLCGGITVRSNIAATMIELLHTATLIHDDVVDEADRRRGFLSINKIWKNKASVLLGDFLLAKGLLVAVESGEYELLGALSTAVKKMSEGELRQMKASKLQNMTEEKYYRIISEKTGSLLVACCECGAISADAPPEVRSRMKEIGHHIGIAFQIRDDLLDYEDIQTGKTSGNDIIERKITLPFIAALDSAGLTARRRMRWLYRKKGKTSGDVERIRTFVEENGGLDYTRKKMEYHAGKALAALGEFPDSETRTLFSEFIRFVIYRKK